MLHIYIYDISRLRVKEVLRGLHTKEILLGASETSWIMDNAFSKNLGATLKFSAPERGHETSSTLGTHNSAVTCVPLCYLTPSARFMWQHTYFCM